MDDALPAVLNEVVLPDQPRSVRARRAAELIRDATAARWVGIYTVAAGTVSNEAWSGTGPPAHPTFPATEGLTAHAIAARAVALSNDVAADPRYLTNQADTASELIIPIFSEHRVLGTLDIESGDVGAFSGTVVAHYETLAQALRPLWDDAELGADAPAN